MSAEHRPETQAPPRPEQAHSAAARVASQRRSARILLALGIVAIALSALTLASAGYGSRPTRSFAQRRSYNMVKTEVHRALPRALLIGLAGLWLAMAGQRRLSRLDADADADGGAGPRSSSSTADSAVDHHEEHS